jgi:hypothetical protein
MWVWFLWRKLKGPLKKLLGKNFSRLSDQFKALCSSIVDDVASATQAGLPLEVIKHVAQGDISKGKETLIFIRALPLDAISNSSSIRKSLIERIKANVRLDAARTKSGIGNVEWNQILDSYAGNVLSIVLPDAIRKMSDNELPLYAGDYIIDLADSEPIRFAGTPEDHQLIVLYLKIDDRKHPTVSQAKKIWKNRNSRSVTYTLGPYDGFKAT